MAKKFRESREQMWSNERPQQSERILRSEDPASVYSIITKDFFKYSFEKEVQILIIYYLIRY